MTLHDYLYKYVNGKSSNDRRGPKAVLSEKEGEAVLKTALDHGAAGLPLTLEKAEKRKVHYPHPVHCPLAFPFTGGPLIGKAVARIKCGLSVAQRDDGGTKW